jgi:hypothetical protein
LRRWRFRSFGGKDQPSVSGSTVWHGAFRFRQYLKGTKPTGGEQPDNNLRELEFKKNQYAALKRGGQHCPRAILHQLDKLFRSLPSVFGACLADDRANRSAHQVTIPRG